MENREEVDVPLENSGFDMESSSANRDEVEAFEDFGVLFGGLFGVLCGVDDFFGVDATDVFNG